MHKDFWRMTQKLTGNLIVISGPSGVGKSTLVGKVREKLSGLEFSVSCTTRKPRPGETHGKEYYFISDGEFEKKIAEGGFLEHAGIFGRRYGTLKSEVEKRIGSGGQLLLDIDVQGAKQIQTAEKTSPLLHGRCHYILIAPPSLPVLEKRLRDRATESPEQLELRIGAARRELQNYRIYDYIIVNDDLEQAAEELYCVLKSFRFRTANLKEELFQ